MQQAQTRPGHTRCATLTAPRQDPLSFRSRKQQQIKTRIMQITTWLAVVLLTARTPAALAASGSGAQPSSSRLPRGDRQPSGEHGPAHIFTFHPHPQTSVQDAEEEKGGKLPLCFASMPLCGARGRAGSGCARRRACDPSCKDGDYRPGRTSTASSEITGQKSSSFQLTLSPCQTEEGIMLGFAREKIKSEGIFKGNCLGCPGMSPASEGVPANAAHPEPTLRHSG